MILRGQNDPTIHGVHEPLQGGYVGQHLVTISGQSGNQTLLSTIYNVSATGSVVSMLC